MGLVIKGKEKDYPFSDVVAMKYIKGSQDFINFIAPFSIKEISHNMTLVYDERGVVSNGATFCEGEAKDIWAVKFLGFEDRPLIFFWNKEERNHINFTK